MTLTRLRTYRCTLLDEELRASYWRRLLQARRDLLRADNAPGDRAGLTAALTEMRGVNTRQVIITLHPDGGMPILPHLPELWASGVDVGDDAERAQLFSRLSSAESVLSPTARRCTGGSTARPPSSWRATTTTRPSASSRCRRWPDRLPPLPAAVSRPTS